MRFLPQVVLLSRNTLSGCNGPAIQPDNYNEDVPLLIRLLLKEVIQPHLPIRLPCYDFTPVIGFTLGGCPPINLG